MTKRGWVILALWYVILISAGNIFTYAHPPANPNNPDALTTFFDMAFFALLFAGIILIPRRYRKTLPDQESPTTQNAH